MTNQDIHHSNRKIVVLSPHRDDAAFSCGLLLSKLIAHTCELTVLNVFTTSDYAPYLTSNGSDRVSQVSSEREAEDLKFASVLRRTSGSNLKALHFIDLGWKDAPLRLQIETENVLQTSVDRGEETLLAEQIRSVGIADALVLAPLAVGDHTDHLLVRDAARRTFAPTNLIFYEDLPYVCRLASAAKALDTVLPSWLSPPTTAGTKRKHALCYPSQIGPEVAEEMEAYSASLGGRERFYAEPEAISHLEALLSN